MGGIENQTKLIIQWLGAWFIIGRTIGYYYLISIRCWWSLDLNNIHK